MSQAETVGSAARELPSEPRREPEDTSERLLDAAERLFAERGFEGASLRAITQAAGTSVSAANYHFGSKEGLLAATLRRHVQPVIETRLARLAALEEAAAGAPLEIEAVLDAFLRPVFEQRAADAEKRQAYRRISARLFHDPPDVVSHLKEDLFAEVSERFLDALARALPDKSREELGLSLQYLVAIMVHVVAGHLEDAPSMGTPALVLDDEALLAHMVAFVAAGLRASKEVPRASKEVPR